MRRAALAKQLIDAPNDNARGRLIAEYRHLADDRLAVELRNACYAAWTVEPVRAQRAASAASILSKLDPGPAVNATAAWLRGIADITKGRFETAVVSLDEAAAALTDKADAAQVQVAKLLALAMLGRYAEAIGAGRSAQRVFAATGDQLAAGKIEMNLSNIVSRQGKYREAEKYGLSALRRFRRSGERTWQAMAENSLANTYTDLNDLSKAEKFSRLALETARGQKMSVTQAEIEANLGNISMLRGRFGDALRSLESSRQRYDELAMPHQSAIADLEIGDIYLELNLLAEADEIYSRVSSSFRHLKMRAEEARTRLNHGRVLVRLNRAAAASRELRRASKLFAAEGNASGQAVVRMVQARLAIDRRRPTEAVDHLREAAVVIRQGGTPRQNIYLLLLEGEALAVDGHVSDAGKKYAAAAELSKKSEQPATLQLSLNLLGEAALSNGHRKKARSYFERSIDVVERLRSPIGAADAGMAFLASRLGSYENLARLYLSENKFSDAFATIERGRSRGLLDAIGETSARRGASAKLAARAAELRAELNIRYKELERSDSDVDKLQKTIGKTESELVKANRQLSNLAATGKQNEKAAGPIDAAQIQLHLNDRTLVEFVEFDGVVSAFVVDLDQVRYFPGLTTVDNVGRLLEELHFQFGALRYGGAMSRFAEQLKQRADAVLVRLYDEIIRPIESELRNEQLVIVPAGPLHYVPFAALHDGERYMAERFEITSAPSAAVWRELQGRKRGKFRSSLLMAHADERIPMVEHEVRELRKIAAQPAVFTGSKATFDAFQAEAGRHDLIHLACHGQFRPDNPMFSSLHLADGWITVQDLTSQRLRAKLVTLSACETGLSKVFAGDELLGLARGFLAAGAASLVVSLWTVNDEAAARLMQRFYLFLQRGQSVAASLKDAQFELIADGAHPYLWAPFVAIGR